MDAYPKDMFGYSPDPETVARFKAEVHDQAELVDPGCEHHWGDITLGWALANGMSPDGEVRGSAHDFARYIRYHTELA